MDWYMNANEQSKSLFVSAGHSESDPGAHGNSLTEADVVLELRDALCDELGQRDMVLTRDGEPGQNLPLGDRVEYAHRLRARLLRQRGPARGHYCAAPLQHRPESRLRCNFAKSFGRLAIAGIPRCLA